MRRTGPAEVGELDLGVDTTTPAGELLPMSWARFAQWEYRAIGAGLVIVATPRHSSALAQARMEEPCKTPLVAHNGRP